MIVKKNSVLFTFVFFVFCDSAFIDKLPKCHLNDNECLRNLYQTVISDIGKHGIPDLKIPPVDPIRLTNVTVSVLDLVNITMVEGVAKGIKDCIFEKFRTPIVNIWRHQKGTLGTADAGVTNINITEEIGHQENTCDVTIKGHYRVEVASPLVQTFLGGESIHGDGNGKVKIDKLHLKFDFPFYAQRHEDGEIYIRCIYDLIKYDYEIRGRVGFFADNLYMGDQEVSKEIVALLNENWNFVMSAFGQPFIDKAMEFYFKFAGYFFDNIPAKYYIIDDLSPYARP